MKRVRLTVWAMVVMVFMGPFAEAKDFREKEKATVYEIVKEKDPGESFLVIDEPSSIPELRRKYPKLKPRSKRKITKLTARQIKKRLGNKVMAEASAAKTQNTPLKIPTNLAIVTKKTDKEIISVRAVIPEVPLKFRSTVYFRFGSSFLGPGNKRKLDDLDPKKTYDVFGYTDWRGSREVNEKLANARAERVAAYLKKKGFKVGSVNGLRLCCYPDTSEKERWASRRAKVEATDVDIEPIGKEKEVKPPVKTGFMPPSSMLALYDMFSRITLGTCGSEEDTCGSEGTQSQTTPWSISKVLSSAKAKSLFKEQFPEAKIITSFKKGPFPNSYEVWADGRIFYFVPPNYLLLGDVLLKTDSGMENLTAKSKEIKAKEALKELPYDTAIRIGNGPVTVIEFADPDCPFCRKAAKWFKALDPDAKKNITRYVFMYPLPFHKDAPQKAKAILCSSNKVEAYEKALSGEFDEGVELPAGCEEVASPVLESHLEVGARLGIGGTPQFWINGENVQGANMQKVAELLRKSGVNVKEVVISKEPVNEHQNVKKVDPALLDKVALQTAIRIGNGPVTVIEFADPDCPFCRKAAKWFNSRSDISEKITRYVFMTPIDQLHPDARRKSKAILCSSNKVEAYEKALAGGMDKEKGLPAGCDEMKAGNLVKDNQVWAKTFGMRGTPHFSINGNIVQGADTSRLERTIESEYSKILRKEDGKDE